MRGKFRTSTTRLAVASLTLTALLFSAPARATPGKLYLSCHAVYPSINQETDYAIVIDAATDTIRVDGKTITREGVDRRSVQFDDGTTRTFFDQLFQLDDEMVRWGVVSSDGKPPSMSSVNRVTGQFRNQYASGACKPVTGPAF